MKHFNALQMGVAAVTALSAGPVVAQQSVDIAPAKVTAWYVGGAIGRDGFKTGYAQTKANIAATGATQATISDDAKETMWKAYIGYQILPQFSIEGGYWNFGKPSYSAAITSNVPVTTMRRSFNVDGYGVDAVLWLPMAGAFSGFGKIGAIQTNTRASTADPGGGLIPLPAESARKLNSHWGLGVTYDIRRDLAARLEFETARNVGDAAKFGSADVLMWSLGMDYRF